VLRCSLRGIRTGSTFIGSLAQDPENNNKIEATPKKINSRHFLFISLFHSLFGALKNRLPQNTPLHQIGNQYLLSPLGARIFPLHASKHQQRFKKMQEGGKSRVGGNLAG
jgi:hypothetical protein